VHVEDIIKIFLKNVHENDFIIKKNYTIVKGVQQSYGKWPTTYGNTLLLDSNHFMGDLADMIKLNAEIFFTNNLFDHDKFQVIDELHL
jgi:hypothetical protein